MRYPKAFLDLQLRLAARVAELSDLPLEQAILAYTNIYIRFAIGRDFDPGHPVWRDYGDGLKQARDLNEWTYRFYLTRPPSDPAHVAATFGCFAYSLVPADRIRLHFENRDEGPASPLSPERVDARRNELQSLFRHVRQIQPDVRTVAGVSWLYNLPAYRRLFPETYIESATVARDRFRNMPLWGQFLDRQLKVKEAKACILRERASRLSNLDHLGDCFPLQPLAVEAPVSDFYQSLGL